MARRIGKKERLAAALLRLTREDVATVESDLARAVTFESPDDRAVLVHDARKKLKAARALVWVLERRFGRKAREARRGLGDVGRHLSQTRDADVMAATATALGFNGVATELAAHGHDHDGEAIDLARRGIGKSAALLDRIPADFKGRALMHDAFDHAYRRGRKAMRRARASGVADDLHVWRKDAKRLYYLLDASQRKLPDNARGLVRRLDRLGDVLGLDHDHAILAERLAAMEDGPDLAGKLARIEARRDDLQREAWRLGRRIYGASPRRFRSRVRLSKARR